MAKKKVEVALQDEVETQEEWENLLQREGLIIVDVYQDWSGPCKAVVGLFRRLKTELNDDLLQFAVAKSDTIEALEKYRGKCEPCFLFFGGGYLVAAVRGVNPPELERNIIEKLKQEHEVMNGEAERIEIRDPVLLAQEVAEEEERRRKEEEEEVPQEVTIVVLKPDIVESGQTEDLVNELIANGYDVIEREQYTFSTEDAEKFYENSKNEPYFRDLIDFMVSGPCEVLLCAKGPEGVIEDLRDLIGPPIPQPEPEEEVVALVVKTEEEPAEETKETEPEEKVQDEEPEGGKEEKHITLRVKYGTSAIKNAIHASANKEEATKELEFFYPNFVPPMVTVRRPKPRVESSAESVEPSMYGPASKYYGIGEGIPGIQRTIAIIRPKAYVAHKEEILSRIKDAGFVIAIQKEVTLTDSQAQEYYKGRKEEPDYEELIKMVADQPMLVLLLAKNEAIKAWKDLLGPEDVEKAKLDAPDCLRAQYYITESEVDEEGNVTASREVDQLEGSADEEDVERGLDFFFPVERTLAAIKPDAYANRDEIIERIKSAGFQIVSKKDVQLTEEVAAQYYADVKDKPFFDDLVKHMASGHSLFLVLTRRDAIAGWRKLMGSTDPDKAADESPDKDDPNLMNLRATYGKNVLENAVHGASDEQHAARAIELIFGDPNVGLPGETSPEGEEEGGAEGQGEEGQLEGQEDKAEGEESKAEGEEIKAEGEKSKAEDEEGKPEGEEGAEAEPATKPGEEESAEKTEGTEKPEGEIPAADKPQEEAPDADKAEPQASETAAEEAGTASKEEKPPSEEKADEPPPEPESTPASPDEPVEVAEGQADDVMAENQNASADPSTRRTSATGTSSRPTSDYSQKSGGRKRSADGETRLSSNQSHRYTPEGKVPVRVPVDLVSCKCNPYFRSGKRRRPTDDKVARKRAHIGIEAECKKPHKLKNFIRRRHLSAH